MVYDSLFTPTQKQPYMQACERDLDCEVEPESWSSRLQFSQKANLNEQYLQQRLLLRRWYLVTTRLARMYQTASTECFRDCKLHGTMLHIWWECPKIRNFWNKLFSMLYKLTGSPIKQRPHLAQLHDFPSGLPRPMKCLVYFVLLAAKITIAGA